MRLQRLYSLTRQAIDRYSMISENDRIAIGISGGKDSLTLLYALSGLRHFYPAKFELAAITIDLGYGNQDFQRIRELCTELDVEYSIVHTEISSIVFDIRKESNPCSLCAKMRKGALNNEALRLGCNKVAYAHHKDDIIETMMMSLMYEGRFYSFPPVTFLEKTKLQVIRPMMFVNEADVIGFANKVNLPVAKNPCPVDGHTKREYVKKLIKDMNTQNPGVKDRIFHAITNGNIEDWPNVLS